MTATDDTLLVQLITLLAQKHFPSIDVDSVEKAVTLLMGGDADE